MGTKLQCTRTVKFRQRGQKGDKGDSGQDLTQMKRINTYERSYAYSAYVGYCAKGHSEPWGVSGYTNTHLAVGDIAYGEGVVSDMNNVCCYYYGKITAITSSQVTMDMLGLVVGMLPDDGKAFYDYAGVWASGMSVQNTVNVGKYVKATVNNQTGLYMNVAGGDIAVTESPASKPGYWRKMVSSQQYYMAKAFFGDYAEFGSAIISGDWMISKNGTIDGTAYNNGALYNGSAAYTRFDPAHPNESNNHSFVPKLALDLKAGKAYLHDAELIGKIIASSGTIGGFEINADSLKAYNNGTLVIALYSDGHGQLGNNGIQWDKNGVFTVTEAFAKSIMRLLANGLGTYAEDGTWHATNTIKITPNGIDLNTEASYNSYDAHFGTAELSISHSGPMSFSEKVELTRDGLKFEQDIPDVENDSMVHMETEYGLNSVTTDTTFCLSRKDANDEEIGSIGFYGTTSPYVQIRSYEAANHIDAYFRCAGANATMKATGVARIEGYTITSSTTIVADSDERLKDIKGEAKGNIEKIAAVRVVNFSYKSDDTKSMHLGTIAQDWQDIYPNAVKENAEGFLGLDYPAIAVAAAVENAKEVVKLREENEELKKRLAAIEKKLGI